MNSLSQNTSLLNTDPSHELAFFLSLLDAPFAPFMSSFDYASMMTNASSWFYSFLRKAFVSAIEKADYRWRFRQSSMWTYAFLFSSLMVEGETLLPQRASVMSSTRRTDTPARYISMRASSTLLSRRRYRSMMAVSKEIPLSLGTLRVTSPEGVVRLRL